MNIQLRHLIVVTRRTVERIDFADVVTFIYGPIGKGKSTVARLVDFCLGGELERTPAIQKEFVSVELSLILGQFDCTIERAASDNQSVRVTWSGPDDACGSVNAPLNAQDEKLLDDAEVYNLSDLIFYLCDTIPIKVRRSLRSPDSPLIRLSIRDIWRYCYLDQTHLDSSFFRLEDPFRGRKSQDAMKFFTGLYSERLNDIEADLMRAVDEQRTKRESVRQIRSFMERFGLGSEIEMVDQLVTAETQRAAAEQKRIELDLTRFAQTHPTDALRTELRVLSMETENIRQAIRESEEAIREQKALKGELITAKTKAARADHAWKILDGVHYQRCPECNTDISGRPENLEVCGLCGTHKVSDSEPNTMELESLRRDLNERIDQIGDSIARRERECSRMHRHLVKAEIRKAALDRQLQEELLRYDSAFVESIRSIEREIATLIERIKSLRQLQQMPEAVNALEEDAGAIQGRIDRLRTSLFEEQTRLRSADANIAAIASEFKRIMLSVGFPGVSCEDTIVIDPRNWKPTVVHGEQEWSFWDTGSGGKKTLFNVCYALSVHAVALKSDLPVPSILIIDSPTKNISEDENPELVQSLYDEIYRLARGQNDRRLQFILIDSEIVEPNEELPGFEERRMAGEPEAPSLIPYYIGP